MRQFLSVEMRYRWLERNPKKPSTKCFRCGSGGIFPLLPPSSGASPCTEYFTRPRGSQGSAFRCKINPNKASMLIFQPAQKYSAAPSCRRSLCELVLPDPGCSRAEFKEQDSVCCFSPALLRRHLVLLFTIKLPTLEGGLFYKWSCSSRHQEYTWEWSGRAEGSISVISEYEKVPLCCSELGFHFRECLEKVRSWVWAGAVCVSYGMNITPGGGDTLCVVLLGIYWRKIFTGVAEKETTLIIQAFSWCLWVSCPCRYAGNSCSLKYETSFFLLLAQFIIWICSWKSKTKPQNLPTPHMVWWTKIWSEIKSLGSISLEFLGFYCFLLKVHYSMQAGSRLQISNRISAKIEDGYWNNLIYSPSDGTIGTWHSFLYCRSIVGWPFLKGSVNSRMKETRIYQWNHIDFRVSIPQEGTVEPDSPANVTQDREWGGRVTEGKRTKLFCTFQLPFLFSSSWY